MSVRTAATIARIAVLLVACARAGQAGQAGCPSPIRPHDTVWMISSRGLGCDASPQQLEYRQYLPEQSWVVSSLAEFNAHNDPGVVTTVFVHGNRISADEAFAKGWLAYRKLVGCAGERPIRFVVWSWPSDRVACPVVDGRIKAARADVDAYYFACFLNGIDQPVPLGLWGHSFGARIISGALHLTGGGMHCGRRLEPSSKGKRGSRQVVLVASALDCDWLLTGHRHGGAISQVDAMLLVNNSCDRVLKRYGLLYHRRSNRQALGYTGLAVHCLPPQDAAKIKQIDACCQVGKEHGIDNYLYSPSLMSAMRDYLLFESDPASDQRADGPALGAAASEEPDVADPAYSEQLADLLMI